MQIHEDGAKKRVSKRILLSYRLYKCLSVVVYVCTYVSVCVFYGRRNLKLPAPTTAHQRPSSANGLGNSQGNNRK